VIEDACQLAWSRLLRTPEVQPVGALSWLVTTAVREAIRASRREELELSLDEEAPESGEPAGWGLVDALDVHEVAARREVIRSIGDLPERQRRMLWLQAAGFTHSEISREVGCTRRTVVRQLARAKQRLRAEAAA
jgi:RNA polymerase sigma factor (sigma-70 family)